MRKHVHNANENGKGIIGQFSRFIASLVTAWQFELQYSPDLFIIKACKHDKEKGGYQFLYYNVWIISGKKKVSPSLRNISYVCSKSIST